jgi:hypothetical protein
MFRLRSLFALAPLPLLLAIALLAGTRDTQAQADRLVWAHAGVGLSDQVYLSSVFMVDENNAWAAGNEMIGTNLVGSAYKLEWGNGRWQVASRQTFRDSIYSIVAVSDSNVWAVGPSGLIAHRDANGWREVPNPVSGHFTATITTIQMLGDGEEGWAGGAEAADEPTQTRPSGALLLHYKDGQWQRDTSLSSRSAIVDLHFTEGGAWAVGSDASIWRRAGGAWVRETTPLCSAATPPPSGSRCSYLLASVRALSSDEAWIAGEYNQTYAAPFVQEALLLHRVGGAWQQDLPGQGAVGDPLAPVRTGSVLASLSFSKDGVGLAVGSQVVRQGTGETPWHVLPYVLRYQADRRWHYESTPEFLQQQGSSLRAVSQADSTHALAVGNQGIVLSYGYGVPQPQPQTATPTATSTPLPVGTPLPTTRVADPSDERIIFFPLVEHTLRGGFRDYWEQHGSYVQFGYPLTEEFVETSPTDGKPYVVQYFERARFEWHPANRPPYDVLLGLLGHTITAGRKSELPFRPAPAQASPGSVYFPETGHNMPPQFVDYWRTHGGLPVYGYPISEAFTETSPTDGKPYLVQYFERNRFEWHPELPEAYRVSLGLLGVQVLRTRGWIP